MKLKKKISINKKKKKTNINLGQHFILMIQVMKSRSSHKKTIKPNSQPIKCWGTELKKKKQNHFQKIIKKIKRIWIKFDMKIK
jgi:hypothetical protein